MGLAEILALFPAAVKLIDMITELAKANGATDDEIRAAIEKRGDQAIKDLNSQIAKDKEDEEDQFPSP